MPMNKFFRAFQKPNQKEARAFTTWANEHALTIDPLDGLNTDIDMFSCLDPFLEGKRVVYLGEEDHWIHEKNDYRLLLLRYLVARGWRYIGEELGWSDGIRIDAYLESGQEEHLERIAAYGYQGALREDREDKPAGILKSQSNHYPVTEFKYEQLKLIKALRCISEECKASSDRIHYFGFDLDTLTGGGYEDIEELLNPFQNELIVTDILSMIKRISGETLEDEMKRLAKALGKIKTLGNDFRKLLGNNLYCLFQEHVHTLYDSLRFNQVINPALDYKTIGIAMAEREKVMQRHVKFSLSHMKPNDKLVLMGHNRHLSKESGLIKKVGPASPGGYHGQSLGTYINRLLPEQVFAIWQLHGQGLGSQPYEDLKNEYTIIPGSLNSILSEVASNFLILTTEVPLLKKEMDITGIYNAVFRTSIAKQADAIFFIRDVSPLRI